MKQKSVVGAAVIVAFGSASLAASAATALRVHLSPAAIRWEVGEFWRRQVHPLLTWSENERADRADAERRLKAQSHPIQ